LERHIKQDEEELLILRRDLQTIETLQAQVEERLEEYTRRAAADASKIQELSRNVEHLSTLPNPALDVPGDLLEAVQAFVSKQAEDMGTRCSKALIDLCLKSNRVLQNELDKKLLPLQHLTDAIYRRVKDGETVGQTDP
ncbi:hypothetical protein H0H93_016430, partial [Arthromyces matolae]